MARFFALPKGRIYGLGAICTALVCLGPPAQTATAPIPNLAPDDHTSWYPYRANPDLQDNDDFLPPLSGPGPVLSPPDHPYRPNRGFDDAGAKPTYRIGDLTNPILQPWVIAQMKKTNDEVAAGKVPFIARERCYPASVAGWAIFRRVGPPSIFFVQTPKEVVMIWRTDNQVRHIYMNVPHSARPKPSWYGESVGHYEGGDTLVVDTIEIEAHPLSFIDNYRTPHTDKLHVVERYHVTDGGKFMDVDVHVEDPGAFTMPWNARQRLGRFEGRGEGLAGRGPLVESICAENNNDFFNFDVVPIPQTDKPDF